MYAFSGDPITYGHIDIIERASKAFSSVVVGIGVNPDKKYMFDLSERTEMAKRALSKYSNVEVVSFQGLLVDFAYENSIGVIVKGVRNAADFDYENALHQIGESQKLGIDTHILFARPELAHVSSSAVKGILKEQGSIEQYVPLHVKQSLEARMCGQYIVGVTGEIGSGKSYVSKRFVELGQAKGINVYDLDLDAIGHEILGWLPQPKYEEVRTQIVETFGSSIQLADGTINRKTLGNIVFNDPAALVQLNNIMSTPLLVRARRELYGKKGLILFNAALIAESNLSYLCNNNVCLVYADKDTQKTRLASRGLNLAQMQRRLKTQYNFEEKQNILQQTIDRDNQGKIWVVNNSEGKDEIERTLDDIITGLSAK